MIERTPLLRRAIPWILGGTLVVLAILAITRIVALREQLATQELLQAEDRLERRVRAWEDSFFSRLDTWSASAAERSQAPRPVQEQLQAQTTWVEGLYLWEPAKPTSLQGPHGATRARMIYPIARPTTDRLYVTQHPCIKAAWEGSLADATPSTRAGAYLRGCAGAPHAVRLQAAIEAAILLDRDGRYADALAALNSTGFEPEIGLVEGIALSLPADRLIVFRNLRSELLMKAGRVDDALALYYATGQQIAELNAPDAIGLDTYRWSILHELEAHGQPLMKQRLELSLQTMDRRIRAWRELEDRVLPNTVVLSSAAPRLIRDQYNDRPYLLYYGVQETSSERRIGVALQLDQERILGEFLANNPRLRDHLAITDASGAWVLGARRAQDSIAVSVPFTRSMPHLRAALYSGALQDRLGDLSDQWIIPLIVTAFLLLVGFFALSSQISAQRSLTQMLARQREFTTRVTHELKTPIAGIKVMAENLEAGAWRDASHREQMARRIVDEADRLSARVEEVLQLTQQRRVPDPIDFDVEELLYELIDIWGPRMQQAGVQLSADLDVAPMVHGDPHAVRDAVGCLLDNALKYRDVTKEEQVILLEMHTKNGNAVVVVTDNGLGVPAAMRKSIFERFVRVEGSHRGMSGGHGLGLAQVAQAARSHGGAITCDEGVDGGSRFTLRLQGVRE
ncbi:MAG: signal transduction histidine kinase [Kiritimatiellia bacterium]|jgi:signal transduction histidine kinase